MVQGTQERGAVEMTRLETQVKGQVSGKRALEDGDTWAGSGGGADAPPLGSFPGPGAVPWRRWAGPRSLAPALAPGQT